MHKCNEGIAEMVILRSMRVSKEVKNAFKNPLMNAKFIKMRIKKAWGRDDFDWRLEFGNVEFGNNDSFYCRSTNSFFV